jgi:hypothetical protein
MIIVGGDSKNALFFVFKEVLILLFPKLTAKLRIWLSHEHTV